MRIATWNVNSISVRLGQLLALLEQTKPDVVCLQETKTEDARFPRGPLEAAGYRCAVAGQKGYNGVAILARTEPRDVATGFADAQKRLLAATIGTVRLACVYAPNGEALGSQKYSYKLAWYARLRDWLVRELARHPSLAVLGDFNVAPEDRDVHDPELWRGRIHCSEEERAAFRALLDVGFVDAFRLFPQPAHSYSWWDYRGGAFRRDAGLRLDLILLSTGLAPRCRACTIERKLRAAERPSDHAPVIAELQP